MKTPAQYTYIIKDLEKKLGELETKGKDSAAITALQTEVNDIEHELNMDYHAAQTLYQGRSASSHLGQKHLSGKKRGESETRLQTEKEEKLEPYLTLKKQMDELVEKVKKIAA